MVLYTIKNLLPIKDILKTLPSSGTNNYIKILQRQCPRKMQSYVLLMLLAYILISDIRRGLHQLENT